MKHVNTKMILGIFIVGAFLLSSLVTPVAALQSVIIEQEMNRAYAPGTNNHTYIYSSVEDVFLQTSFSRLHVNEDIDLTRYRYDNDGWASPDSSYTEPSNPPFAWQDFNSFDNGDFGNPGLLPIFYDFIGTDGSGAVINTTLERRVFSLALGQETAVVMDTRYTYFGTLGISGQEFVHMTVASLQDDVTWEVGVYDPQGRLMIYMGDSDGDVIVLPFRPSIAGTYYIILEATPSTTTFAQFNFYPQAVGAQLLSPGEVFTGNLPTGELKVSDETGSLVHDELAPTCRTYKIDPGTGVSSLYYSFNYPAAFIGVPQDRAIIFSSDAFLYDYMGGTRFFAGIGNPTNDVFSWCGGILYITLMGGDNIDYTLHHASDVAEPLPLNHEFMLDNYYFNPVKEVYSLSLDYPSMIKVNSTAAPADYSISIYGVDEDGYFVEATPADAAYIYSATWEYLPAGEYVVLVTVAATTTEMIEFTIGSIVPGFEAGIVYQGGVMVPTTPAHDYNLTLTLNNVYNVSSTVQIGIYDQFLDWRWGDVLNMGTWWDGVTAIPHSTDVSEVTYTLDERMWSDEYAMITLVVYPYNNTLGIGDTYPDYAMNFTIDWVDVTYDDFDNTATLDVSTSSNAHNFTLVYPLVDTPDEYYSLQLNTTPGTWYNVSIKSADAVSFGWYEIYTPYDQRTHYVGDADLDDTEIGVVSYWSFQFGAISDLVYLDMRVNRADSAEGFLWIEVIPLPTHALKLLPAPAAGGDLLALLGSIALPVGIGAVVIVVVAVVYLKKFKK
ncbi:MAG: hypothetical protein ACFFCT_08890 [Candidatus Odinarchaeota archaeon]